MYYNTIAILSVVMMSFHKSLIFCSCISKSNYLSLQTYSGSWDFKLTPNRLASMLKMPFHTCFLAVLLALQWWKGHVVAQLVEALRYKQEDRGFDSRWCHWNFLLTQSALWALGLTQPLTEMSTRNISWGGKRGRCLGLTILPSSCADCLEIWEPQAPGTLRACPVLSWDCFTFTFHL